MFLNYYHGRYKSSDVFKVNIKTVNGFKSYIKNYKSAQNYTTIEHESKAHNHKKFDEMLMFPIKSSL